MSSERPLVASYAYMGSVISSNLRKIIEAGRVTENSKTPPGLLVDLREFFQKIREAEAGVRTYPNPETFREMADEAFRRAGIELTPEQAYKQLIGMDVLLKEFARIGGKLGPRKLRDVTTAQKFFEQIKLMGNSANYSHHMEESHRHMPSFRRKAF